MFRPKSSSSNENKNELEYIIRIKHEVMLLFTLETQSSKKNLAWLESSWVLSEGPVAYWEIDTLINNINRW